MAKIKYLGSADIVTLEKGENFGGRLAEPLTKKVEWRGDSGHLVDSDEVGLSEAALSLLLEDKERFKDVSDLQVYPTSVNEHTFRGLPKSTKADSEPAAASEGGSEGSPTPVVAEGGQSVAGGAAATAPVGGSTVGRRGTSAAS